MDSVTERLAAIAAGHMGFRLEAVDRYALRRLVESWVAEGGKATNLVERANSGCGRALDRIVQAVSVGETYFFRHPAQLGFVVSEVARRVAVSGTRVVRAWSAGCASGEEAYSLASALLAQLPRHVAVSVLGTDILPIQVERANHGVYGRWSIRGPLPYPIVRARPDDRVEIVPEVRAVTSFRVHNLLDATLPIDDVDLILCRNVLVYFATDTAGHVSRSVARALSKDGCIAFGTVDVASLGDGFAQLGAAELNVYGRKTPRPPLTPVPPQPAFSPSSTPPARLAEDARLRSAIDMHLRALVRLEAGDADGAARLLDVVLDADPAYAPALLERALIGSRAGDRARATRLMRELLSRLSDLPGDELIEGPESSSVQYYRITARAFLGLAEGGQDDGRVVDR